MLQARARGEDFTGHLIARAGAAAHGPATPWLDVEVTVTNRGRAAIDEASIVIPFETV